MQKNLVIGVLALALLGLGAWSWQGERLGSSGNTHYQKESFLQGLSAGTGRQFSLSNAGVLTTSGAATLSGAVTLSGETTLGNCGTATWNPANVTSTVSIETAVTVTGLAAGDVTLASFSLPLQGLILTSSASTTDTASVRLFGAGSVTDVNLATGTLTVCYFD